MFTYTFVGLAFAQESLKRARQDLENARAQAAPLERERAAAAEETRHLQERRTHAEQAHEELRKQVLADCDGKRAVSARSDQKLRF